MLHTIVIIFFTALQNSVIFGQEVNKEEKLKIINELKVKYGDILKDVENYENNQKNEPEIDQNKNNIILLSLECKMNDLIKYNSLNVSKLFPDQENLEKDRVEYQVNTSICIYNIKTMNLFNTIFIKNLEIFDNLSIFYELINIEYKNNKLEPDFSDKDKEMIKFINLHKKIIVDTSKINDNNPNECTNFEKINEIIYYHVYNNFKALNNEFYNIYIKILPDVLNESYDRFKKKFSDNKLQVTTETNRKLSEVSKNIIKNNIFQKDYSTKIQKKIKNDAAHNNKYKNFDLFESFKHYNYILNANQKYENLVEKIKVALKNVEETESLMSDISSTFSNKNKPEEDINLALEKYDQLQELLKFFENERKNSDYGLRSFETENQNDSDNVNVMIKLVKNHPKFVIFIMISLAASTLGMIFILKFR